MVVKRCIFTFFVAVSVLLSLGVAHTHASSTLKYSDCFNQAETNYEQIYCEIKAQGEGASLPSFFDFKKNNEQMQALLIKRKAQALKIPFKMPAKKRTVLHKNKKVEVVSEEHGLSNCQYLEQRIKCNNAVFSIVGNKRNSMLEPNALDKNNKLELGTFSGDRSDNLRVMDYLTESYTRYIEKMLEIGLGGSTMSFTKFYYLFQDLSAQNVDFDERFETMYAYLKMDKRSLGVSERVNAIQGLSIEHCNRLKPDLFTCDNGSMNRIYIKL